MTLPEFHGDTLEEVLGKALGRRDEFGRRITALPIHAIQQKQSGPTNLLGAALQNYLRPLRHVAVQRAIQYLSALYDPENPDEIGYAEWFNRRTGEHDVRETGTAGRPCNKPDGGKHYCFNAPRARGWEILVLGHSHPPTSTLGTRGYVDTRHDDQMSGDDRRLARFGPMVLISPGRDQAEQVDGRSSYDSFDTWPFR